ncbi:Helicase associated domain protein [Rhodococcus jostii]|uniref:DEAD/DEAH box helicase n=1 Tax=Rhodococcus jostii TaxID=132919 RepID=UPI003664DDAF
MTDTVSSAGRRPLEELLQSLSRQSANTTSLGGAFEYVTDLALWSSPEFGARIQHIWRWEDWHGAQGRDLGIDRVVQTTDGELWAVQAKGYGSSTSVTFAGNGGIATFLAAAGTGQFAMQLVVTSSDRVADNARKIAARQSVPTRILDRSWLESLDVDWPADLGALRRAVDAATGGDGPARDALAAGRHQLASHQGTAVHDVVASFAEQSEDAARAKLLMPCGTGKTLTCHAVAEEIGARQVLVLVPSLSLLAQTMRAWQMQSQGQLRVIAVCSDESVVAKSADEIVVAPSELLAPVTTDAHTLAGFLSEHDLQPAVREWPTVVFCTYHSSPVVAAAQRSTPHAFDLVVADEAHYLAGKVSPAFATVLDDAKIKARRRLFATATPRIISTKLKDTLAKDGRDHDVISMDNPAVFGPVAHELRFSQALADKLLTDYQVLILGVDDADIAAMIEQRNLLVLNGTDDEVTTDAATLSAAVATYRTITEHGARRMVSYHSRIAGAEEFARLLTALPPALPTNLTAVQVTAHSVKGTMPAGARRQILNRLTVGTTRSSSPSACVVANARCLTEGVDIPTLDGIIFVDPRRSRIDVVQSVGRAIRRADNKTRGLVVIPVSLHRNQDAETALAGSAFAGVWDVLGALRDHDDTLAEEFDALRTALGRRGTIDRGSLGKIVLDLPVWAGPEFAQAVRLKMVEHTSSSFRYNLGLLQAFADREGHARVPTGHTEAGVKLGNWVASQRSNKDHLTADRREMLEAVPGWTWTPLADAWAASLAAAQAFAAREGHSRVPVEHVEGEIKLGTWVVIQRTAKDRMAPERRALLEALPGWSWDMREDTWADSYSALVSFVQREGHARVPQSHVESGINLGTWVAVQRRNKDTLSPARREQLEELAEWSWDPLADAWNRNFTALTAFIDREGHANVPNKHVEGDTNLGKWVTVQRQNKDTLPPDRRAKLEALPGWSWDARAALWSQKHAALLRFVQREGHARVPQGHLENDIKLGSWVREQRGNKDRLTPARRERLEAVPGWSWDPYADAWNRSYALLVKYAEREGHALVPKDYKEDGMKLGSWVIEQRTNRQKISAERCAQLEAIPGWSWNSIADAWARKFAVLQAFADRQGHARVPVEHEETGIKLGSWVRTQRKNREKLTPDQRALLEALPGWTWNSPHTGAWEQNFAALQSFTGREGHARVPSGHREGDINLGGWVALQRSSKDQMPPERRARLEATSGWSWKPLADAWERSIEAARTFAEREGHTRVPQGHVENGVNLGSWVGVQRGKKHHLSIKRRTQLEALPGWSWDPHADTWAHKLAAIHAFTDREGHPRVPYTHTEVDIALGTWVYDQRKKRDRLTDEQRAQLEALPGWTWA